MIGDPDVIDQQPFWSIPVAIERVWRLQLFSCFSGCIWSIDKSSENIWLCLELRCIICTLYVLPVYLKIYELKIRGRKKT